MPEEESRPSALMMEAEVPSIEAVTMGLLRVTREPALATADRGRIEEEVSFFFNELTTIILNWISTVRMEEIEDLSIAIEAALAGVSETRPDLAIHDRLAARLEMMSYLLRAVLRTENLAKYLGQLSGKRRAAWGELMANLYDADRPVSKTEACELIPSMRNPNTVYHALERLTQMGLLDRIEKDNTNRVSYSLSWRGRLVARTWRELHPGSPADAERHLADYIDALLEPTQALSRSCSWDTDSTGQKEINRKLVVAASK